MSGVAKRIMAADPSLLSEAQFSGLVIELARLGGWAPRYHTVVARHSKRGFPDWVFVKGERLVFAELKTQVGKTTEHQDEWIEALRVVEQATKGLVQVYVWRPGDWPEIVETMTGRRPKEVAA